MRFLGLVLAMAAGLLWGAPAWAQAPNAKVVATCGAASLPLGSSLVQMDQTGDLCTNAGGGGGGAGTPTAGTTGTLTTGGTSYTIVTGAVNGCYVYNGLTAAEQGGIAAAETVNIDPVTTPVVALVTTTTLQPGQLWSCPGKLAAGVLVKANATTNGHKLNVVTW